MTTRRFAFLLLLLGWALGALAAERAYLGIEPDDSANLKALGYEGRGVLIRRVVEDSPAEKAGLLGGDILTHMDGKLLEDADDLSFFLGRKSPGERVALSWWRSGRSQQGSVELEARKGETIDVTVFGLPVASISLENRAFLGVGTLAINTNLLEYFGVEQGHGVLVDAVVKGSPADLAGLQVGDVIVELAGREVDSPGRLRRLLQDQRPGNSVALLIVRQQRPLELRIELGDRDQSLREEPRRGRGLLPQLPALPDLPNLDDLDGLPGVRAMVSTTQLFGRLLGWPLNGAAR
jgi:S1-C subfamily serine protease